MKRIVLALMLVASVMTTGCASKLMAGSDQAAGDKSIEAASGPSSQSAPAKGDQITVNDGSGNVIVQKVEFRPGVSSATVEKLAKRFGCTGTVGAGLITEKGPVEVYRMDCDNGSTFLAQCELRQCRPMRR